MKLSKTLLEFRLQPNPIQLKLIVTVSSNTLMKRPPNGSRAAVRVCISRQNQNWLNRASFFSAGFHVCMLSALFLLHAAINSQMWTFKMQNGSKWGLYANKAAVFNQTPF